MHDAERVDPAEVPESREGVVVRAGRGLYIVQTDDSQADDSQTDDRQIVACRLRGNLKKSLTYPESDSRRRRVARVRKLKETDPVAVGDRVTIALEAGGTYGVIEALHPRRAALARRSGNERERQTLVANLELAVIVFAAAEPRVDPWKLDRFLVLAEDAELNVLIVLNKIDSATMEEIAPVVNEYRRIGYDVLLTSAHTGVGVDDLRARLRNRISALCGPSGAGKSSLLNAVEAGLSLKTGEVGGVTYKGRHTTVQAELLPLSFGGWVADTPGLRQVEYWDLPLEDIAFSFPEMRDLMGQCRFPNCRHRLEPGCAIRAAVEAGMIATRRYESYLEMTKSAL